MSYSERLGRKCWTFFHEMAKGWPLVPDYNLITNFNNFMHAFAEIYPCRKCKAHIKEYIATVQPFPSSLYFCNFHNSVNKRLNKRIYKCTK